MVERCISGLILKGNCVTWMKWRHRYGGCYLEAALVFKLGMLNDTVSYSLLSLKEAWRRVEVGVSNGNFGFFGRLWGS